MTFMKYQIMLIDLLSLPDEEINNTRKSSSVGSASPNHLIENDGELNLLIV